MKIELITIGKNSFPFVNEGIQTYVERTTKYIRFEIKYLSDIKNNVSLNVEARKNKEYELLKKEITPSDFIVLLDQKGKAMTSLDFAGYIQQKMNSGIKDIKFFVGGPYGFADELYQLNYDKISLSKLTFPHDLVRVIFVEQLYRALTILKGEKYHHE